MVEVLFTSDALWQATPPVHYHAGDVVTLRVDRAMRWITRGLATDDAAAIAAAKPAPEPPAPVASSEVVDEGASVVAIPDDWPTFRSVETVKLARDLGAPLSVMTKATATEFIQKEIERRKVL